MINYLKNKIRRHREKRTFTEYGYKIKSFDIPEFGKVQYAQWLHPSESEKLITLSNINFYKKLVTAGGMIIDIGAHTGDTTVPMALAVGKSGIVLGLEPNKYVFKILKKNSELNTNYTNIKPLCFAATEEDGEFTFNYSDASFCNGGFLSQIQSNRHRHSHTLKVTGKNFKNFLVKNYAKDLNRLDLLKIDAEGYDKEIVKGLNEILQEYKPTMLLECYKHLTKVERKELFNSVAQNGYNIYKLNSFDSFRDIELLTLESMNSERHFEMLAIHESNGLNSEIVSGV